jgi:hypothetical protein
MPVPSWLQVLIFPSTHPLFLGFVSQYYLLTPSSPFLAVFFFLCLHVLICSAALFYLKFLTYFRVFLIVFPKREEVTGSWRSLHNEELYNLDASRNILRMIKSRKIRWA